MIKKILPLSKDVSSIAVIGQLADNKDIPLGSWRAQAISNSAVSLLEGVENVVEDKVQFAQGYTLVTGDRSFGKELELVADDRSRFDEAIQLASRSEVVVLALGEDCYQTGEGRSQVDVGLKGNQLELLEAITKVNRNVIVVLMTGRPVAIPEVTELAPAILETWHAGSEAGNAIADVLFGDYSPSGRLPVSFPYSSGQEPLYYNRKSTGRPVNKDENVFWSHYTDSPNEALFPFGYGQTYTEFNYNNLLIEKVDDGLEIQVEVSNIGERAGHEVVQVYVQDMFASLTRPTLELKAFDKIFFEENETKTIRLRLSKDAFSFFNNNGEKVFEPGLFKISVGPNAHDLMSETIQLD